MFFLAHPVLIIKVMHEFLLSVLPIFLSSENNTGPKLAILSRYCTSTRSSRWFFTILFSSLYARNVFIAIVSYCEKSPWPVCVERQNLHNISSLGSALFLEDNNIGNTDNRNWRINLIFDNTKIIDHYEIFTRMEWTKQYCEKSPRPVYWSSVPN